MLTKEGMVVFDEAIRALLVARKAELKLSEKVLGQMAFPYMGKPSGKVRSILVEQGAGDSKKPQEIRLADLVNLCQALGLNLHDVIRSGLRQADGK
ncbi:hypothetical protein [uncultured Desulfovibrio sp.]|uniref:hypothetical protein n=1 Tax=uncultured Desulfovibrio sp. TaxID=167968 RepID=UPI0003B686D5|nr:hypothetical protein [uncultured Desulfovibrio sp.]